MLRGIGRSLIAVAPQKGDHRAAICTAVPLLVLWSLDRLDLRMYASFGVFSALYGRFDAYPDRIRMQLAAGATLVAAMLVGTALAVLDAPTVLRVTVVALVAALVTLIAQAFRWNPPGALFAVALGGAHVTARVVRGLQRLAGTLGGVLIAAGLLALHLPPLVSILVVVLCQVGAQLFVDRNYGIAVLFITTLALLMIELAVPADPAQLLYDRVVDSVIGVAIGTAIAVLSAWLRRRGDDSEKNYGGKLSLTSRASSAVRYGSGC